MHIHGPCFNAHFYFITFLFSRQKSTKFLQNVEKWDFIVLRANIEVKIQTNPKEVMGGSIVYRGEKDIPIIIQLWDRLFLKNSTLYQRSEMTASTVKSYTGEGCASFKKLEKPVWRPTGRQLNSFRSMLFTMVKSGCPYEALIYFV